MAQKLNLLLWEAANILRGSAVDRTDWKGYILPLLFFKRISDVWDEEHARMLKEYGEDFTDEHRFQIPDGCHWDDIRSTAQNVGAALKHAMQEIERVNPDTLYRVFGTGDWGNKEKFTDELIKDMIEGFSAIELGNNAVDTDVLGDAYEYLVGKFADVTRRNKAGEFYTPRSVVRMMVEILDPKEGESIYDPACGTGGMLLAAIDHVKRQGGDPRTFFGKIYGQEKNLTTSSVARMNLVLHGIEDFQIAREDTLRNPAFTDGAGGLAKFDCVIANPPFSLKEWGRDIWENDPWGRTQYGLPPDNYGDYDVVVSHYGEEWPEVVADALVEFVRGGGGLVSIHEQISAVPNSELTGLAWAPSHAGYKLHVNDETGDVVYLPPHHGPGPGHGRQHEFLIKTRQPDHPVMKGLPTVWRHGKDELYHGLRGPAENLTVLASAFSDTALWGSGYHEPIVWTVEFGKGRAFYTLLGHQFWSEYEYHPSHGVVNPGENGSDALHCVGFQTVFARGTEWAATGRVTLPVPQAFPSDSAVSIVPPGVLQW